MAEAFFSEGDALEGFDRPADSPVSISPRTLSLFGPLLPESYCEAGPTWVCIASSVLAAWRSETRQGD